MSVTTHLFRVALGCAATLAAAWLIASSPLLAGEVKFASDDAPYTASDEAWMSYYVPGIIRPDQGTIEFTLIIDRSPNAWGSAWDFLFKMVPAQPIKGFNLFGILFPNLQGVAEPSVQVVARHGDVNTSVYWKKPQYPVNQPINLAITWGTHLKLYINGKQIGSSKMAGPIQPMPALFEVQRMSPFNTQAMKVSSIELPAERLQASPSQPFTADEHTTFLAAKNLTQARTFVSQWHRSSSYSMVMPIWSIADQTRSVGDELFYPVLAINHGSKPANHQVKLTGINQQGEKVLERLEPISVPADGQYHVVKIPLSALDRVGYYQIQAQVSGPSATASYQSAVAVTPKQELGVPDGKYAQYLGYHYDMNHELSALNQAGIQWVRLWGEAPFLWFQVEPDQGQFRWSYADAVVAKAKASNIQLLGVLGYPPNWAAVEPSAEHKAKTDHAKSPGRWKPRNVQEWSNYVYQTVNRYKGYVKHWEIYNEVDFHPPGLPATFSGSTAEYKALLDAAYAAAKKADPESVVLTSGFSLNRVCDQNMVPDLLKMGAAKSFDVFAIHSYNGLYRVDEFKKLLADAKPGVPLWQTEQAWLSIDNDHDRMFLAPAINFWFIDKGFERYFTFGFEEIQFNRYTFSPRIDHFVNVVFQNHLRKADRYLGLQAMGKASDDFSVRHRFQRTDGKYLTVLGTEKSKYELAFNQPLEQASDLYGQPVKDESEGGNASRIAFRQIVYLVSRQPLVVTQAKELDGPPLLVNGSFEQLIGDLPVGGLASCKPANWVYRDTAYDPKGRVELTTSAIDGKYAMLVRSSPELAASRGVYLFQDSKPSKTGTYRLTAMMKKGNPSQKGVPYLSIYDRQNDKIHTLRFEKVGQEYVRCELTANIPSLGIQPLALIAGIVAGDGEVMIDDVQFIRVGE